MRFQWKAHRVVWNLTGGRLGRRAVGMPILELVTTGHKSGNPRSILISYVQTPSGPAIAGTNAGVDYDPAWIRNLRADPAARVREKGEWREVHARFLDGDEWEEAWERFTAADTLIHVDLPLVTHGWWVTKRLVRGLFSAPEGWPEDSPILSSSLNSYRVLWPCHRQLTPKYRQLVADMASTKRVHRLRSPREIRTFLGDIERECATTD